MKSRKIDWYDLEDVERVKELVEFVYTLIPREPMEELLGQVEEIEGEFCRDCNSHKENCCCHTSYNGYDEDYEYDSWRDRQLEEDRDGKSN